MTNQEIVVNSFKRRGAKISNATYMGRKVIAILPSSQNKFIKCIDSDGYDMYIGGNVILENNYIFMSYSLKNT